ncbi:MAG: 2-amino-4-hydroxy-6-hydroxymethyldihydropteridine diphosphokinase [Dehalococcoidia bacterium]|nr:2-amino-4-hydroxy-6-hydroxymethyldihydropteridine diphosphokinase [Dehalococcoidia bacterium]
MTDADAAFEQSAGPASSRVFLALGANLGDREANLRMAVRLLTARARVVGVSSLYRSPAVVREGTPPGPDYLNAVCEIATKLPPHALLRFVKTIEHEVGRRPAPRWSARPIDIDILLYGEEVIETDELTVPHAMLCERDFVLVPLAELAPEVVHPRARRRVGELAEDVAYHGLEHVAGPEWAGERTSRDAG